MPTIYVDPSDKYSFMRSSARRWLDELVRDGSNPAAPAALRRDLELTMRWLGVPQPGEISEGAKKRWADGFVQYLAEGSAPSLPLRAAFAHFADEARASLNVDLTHDIRGVMARLLATDAEIATSTSMQKTMVRPTRTHLVRFRNTRTAVWANVVMDEGAPCWISVARTGVLFKKSKFGLFGRTLFRCGMSDAIHVAGFLTKRFQVDLTPSDMLHPLLKPFTNATLHCRSVQEVKELLAESIKNSRRDPRLSDQDSDAALDKYLIELLDARAESPRTDLKQQPTIDRSEAQRLINDFGAALGRAASRLVADVADLPASKQEIKEAIFIALSLAHDERMREQLRIAYVSLAMFQEGGSGTPSDIIRMDMSPNEAIAAVPSKGLLNKIKQEEIALVKELKEKGW